MSRPATQRWDSSTRDLFPHTVTLSPPAARNVYGKQAPSSTTYVVAAHIEHKMRQMRTMQGDLSMSSIAVYLSGEDGVLGVTPEWTLTLPDETSRPILSVSRYADERGDLFEVIYLQ